MKGINTMNLRTLALLPIAILSFAVYVFGQAPQATPPPPAVIRRFASESVTIRSAPGTGLKSTPKPVAPGKLKREPIAVAPPVNVLIV